MTPRQSGQSDSLRSFDSPDQHGQFDHGECRIIDMQGTPVGLLRLQKGFRYSEAFGDAKVSKRPHTGYITRGSLYVQDSDGQEFTAEVGRVVTLEPDYDYWTDQDTEMIDWSNPQDFITTGSLT